MRMVWESTVDQSWHPPLMFEKCHLRSRGPRGE